MDVRMDGIVEALSTRPAGKGNDQYKKEGKATTVAGILAARPSPGSWRYMARYYHSCGQCGVGGAKWHPRFSSDPGLRLL